MTTRSNRYIHEANLATQLRFGHVGRHESIYKYISLDGKQSWNYFLKTLEESELIGATLSSLNDPLEGNPRIFNDLSDDVYESCSIYFDREGLRRDQREDKRSLKYEDLELNIRDRIKNTREKARILSFARRSDSHLLWSHYANAHRGACLHFNASAFEDRRVTVGAVSYTQYRPVVPMSLLARIALAPRKDQHLEDRKRYRSEVYSSLFFTKPLDWAYEEEVRIIYSTSDMTNVCFVRSGLYEVILGAKCSQDDATQIQEMINDFASNVVVRKAKLSEDTFGVEIQ